MRKGKFTIPTICLSLLLIPLVGMQFTETIQWSLFDFVVMGLLLLGLGFGIRWIWGKKLKNQTTRNYIVLLILGFLLLWAELAVGIFGTPFSGS